MAPHGTSPFDTTLSVLDEFGNRIFQVTKGGDVLFQSMDMAASDTMVLVWDPTDGSVHFRPLHNWAFGDSLPADGDWERFGNDLVNMGDSTVIIHGGATTDPVIEVYAKGVYSAGERFFKAHTTHTGGDYIAIQSGTSANNYLTPTLVGHVEEASGSALVLLAETSASRDVDNAPLMVFDARRTNGSIATRPLFQWRSYTSNKMTMTSDGYLGIGVTSPSFQLELSTNDAAKAGGGHWYTLSDSRTKKAIRPFEDGLEILMQIQPVWYQYNGLAGMPKGIDFVGVIADSMQKVAPYTIKPYVYTSDDGAQTEYLGYDGTALNYILVNALQEQQGTLAKQADQILLLKEQVDLLEQRHSDLTEKLDQLAPGNGGKTIRKASLN